MKRNLILILVLLCIVFILVIIKSLEKNNYKLGANAVHELSLLRGNVLTINELNVKISEETKNKIRIIDLRKDTTIKPNNFSIDINIQFENIIDGFANLYNENDIFILFSSSIAESAKAWNLLTQMGYKNLYVLDFQEGNVNNIVNTSNEILKYTFQPDTSIGPEE